MDCRVGWILVLLSGFILQIGTACAGTDERREFAEFLLNVKNPRFYHDGRYNELAAIRHWEEQMIGFKKRALTSNATTEDLKLFLAVGWAARLRNSAITAEYMNSNVHPVFQKQTSLALSAMSETPYLIGTTCGYLAKWFSFERDVPDTKGMKAYRETLEQLLPQRFSADQVRECLSGYDRAE